MVEIIGNNIMTILNARKSKAEDPDAQFDRDLAELGKHFANNRLTGLMKGSYSIQLREAAIIKEVFDLSSIDEVIITKKLRHAVPG